MPEEPEFSLEDLPIKLFINRTQNFKRKHVKIFSNNSLFHGYAFY